MSHLCDVCREEWATKGIHVRGRFIYVGRSCAEKITALHDRNYRQ